MKWPASVLRLKLFMPAMHTVVLTLSFVCCVTEVLSKENVKIKIAEPPSTTHFQSYSSSRILSLRTDPAPVSGPVHLQCLNGECFKGKEKGYEYIVCPFQNVTQKEERSSWNSFHGVLGVWHEWIVENDTIAGMLFTMGERCGMLDREAKVMFNCSTSTRLHSMSEPSTCSYKIVLDTPLACLKGAMQVFHLLTEEQLTAWNSFEKEYYRDEITLQGLSKRRKKILIEAGLLRRPKEPEKPKDVEPVVIVNHQSDCEKEKEVLEARLKELQSKVDILVREHPNIAREVGFVSSNHTISDSADQNNVTSVPVSSLSLGMNSTTLSQPLEHLNKTVTA